MDGSNMVLKLMLSVGIGIPILFLTVDRRLELYLDPLNDMIRYGDGSATRTLLLADVALWPLSQL